MMPEKEECPCTATEAPQNPATDDFSITAEKAVIGVYVAVVQTGVDNVRRRIYLSLAPAQKAVQRARAAGVRASLVVAEIQPAGGDS